MKTEINKDLENDIYFALEILNHNYTDTVKFNNYSHIYRFTNEPINSYAKYLKDKKDILSVTGSGDQILKCITYGTKNVDTFDISNFPKYFLDMKVAAASNLSKEEFYKMFYSDEFETNGSNMLYPKFRDEMPLRSKIFWDSLMSSYSWGQIYSSRLFTHRNGLGFVNDKEKMIEHYSFLKDDEYEKLKENSKKVSINSFTSNISDLNDNIGNSSYDLAFFSNIVDYVKVDLFKDYISNLRINNGGILLNTFNIASGANRYNDYQLLKDDGFKEEKTDRITRLLVKKF